MVATAILNMCGQMSWYSADKYTPQKYSPQRSSGNSGDSSNLMATEGVIELSMDGILSTGGGHSRTMENSTEIKPLTVPGRTRFYCEGSARYWIWTSTIERNNSLWIA